MEFDERIQSRIILFKKLNNKLTTAEVIELYFTELSEMSKIKDINEFKKLYGGI